MAKIGSYTVANPPVLGSDMLIGTDVNDNNATKNFTISQLVSFISSSNTFVPYTGATGNVNLGANTLTVDNANFQGGVQINNLQLSGNFTAPSSKIYLNYTPGISGQVLTSQGTSGGVVWADPSIGYKVYTAIITQSGTSAPTVDTVLQNTLGDTPTFTYDSAGKYLLLVTNFAFTSAKTVVFMSQGYMPSGFVETGVVLGWERNSNNQITIKSKDSSTGINSDGLLYASSIEIRVYP